MTDQDVIEHLHAVRRVGSVYVAGTAAGKKPAWTWQVGKATGQLELLRALRPPHMARRRAARIA